MNVNFRRFILNAHVQDREYGQSLLFQTQNLFGYLQGSIRRFVNPEDCVFAIKTYEDTQIEHPQSDGCRRVLQPLIRPLGEPAQGAEAKREFRSFYGGQLVQQVSSKECEHISERLEPFSAIQCDIKGKNSLEESLQAYVDGEIMAGGKLATPAPIFTASFATDTKCAFQTTGTSARAAIGMLTQSSG